VKTFDIKSYIEQQQYLLKDIISDKKRELFIVENYIIRKILEEVNSEYFEIVLPIITKKEFIETRKDLHHENISTFTHMLHVSTIAYSLAKKKRIDFKSAAIAGILHDFYLYDWHECNQKKKGIFNMHAFSHPTHAIKNAKKLFPTLLSDNVENSILAHSWHLFILKKIFHPFSFKLSNHLPKSRVAWNVFLADIGASMYSAKNPKMILNSFGLEKCCQGIQLWVLKNHMFILLINILR